MSALLASPVLQAGRRRSRALYRGRARQALDDQGCGHRLAHAVGGSADLIRRKQFNLGGAVPAWIRRALAPVVLS